VEGEKEETEEGKACDTRGVYRFRIRHKDHQVILGEERWERDCCHW